LAAHVLAILRRLPILVATAAVLVLGSAIVLQSPAVAGWSLRDLLFPPQPEPPPLVFPKKPVRPKAKPRIITPKPVEPQAQIADKAQDARVVLVVGDFMASGLADGINAVFADNPNIRVADRTNGSSGLVRDDYYDWPAQIRSVIDAEKPAAVLVMLGSNDRQQMKIGDARESPGSDAWTSEYRARTNRLGQALAESRIPFLWVGMPAFPASKATSDMLAFNDLYRAAAESHGGSFVDVWEGFVDENGDFISVGPDINGQPVSLRSNDGVGMTRAGKRKLAFYVEKPLMKMLGLGGSSQGDQNASPAGTPANVPGKSGAPATTDRTAPMLLSDPALDGGGELLGAQPPTAGTPVADKPATRNGGPAPAPGRADDFSWPKAEPSKTAAGTDTTTAIHP
jgi:hypothetical protein